VQAPFASGSTDDLGRKVVENPDANDFNTT
jgi:hypothetical protein